MAIKEAIILAGGLGTRLRSEVPDLPKCMAPINGKPFLKHVIQHLQTQGIDHFVFSLGYMHEVVETYLRNNFPVLQYSVALEEAPLGTGGAIQLALQFCKEKSVLVTNGDTLFKVDVNALSNMHESLSSDCTLALKPMRNFDRYGVVEINADNRITSFREKQFFFQGLINGGLYALNKAQFLQMGFPEKFSFEKDYLESNYNSKAIHALIQDAYFIDIGIPEDFKKAQNELA